MSEQLYCIGCGKAASPEDVYCASCYTSLRGNPANLITAEDPRFPGKPVRLARVKHVRCGEYDGENTLVWVPATMSREEFVAAVAAAREKYLLFLESYHAVSAPNDYRPHSQPPYGKYPHLTVAQVEELWGTKKGEWEAWDAERKKAKLTFGDYLRDEGMIPFWQRDPEYSTTVNWGHRHGFAIDYDSTKIKDFSAAGSSEEEDV